MREGLRGRMRDRRFGWRRAEMGGNAESALRKTELCVQTREGATYREAFMSTDWADTTYYQALTTHPEIIQSMIVDGPSKLMDYVDEGETKTVMTIPLAYGDNPPLERAHLLTQFTLDGTSGLITLHSPEKVEKIKAKGALHMSERGKTTQVQSNMNLPQQIYYVNEPLYFEPETREQHALKTGMEAIGIFAGDIGEPYTIPLPQELVRRTDELRQTDTTSGVFYPKIRLYPLGGIPYVNYLNAYIDKEHPVGAKNFAYYKHDIVTGHMRAFMIYGEPLMDVVSAVAKQGLTMDAQGIETVSHRIDAATDRIGDIVAVRSSLDAAAVYQFNKLLEYIPQANHDQFQIVQWMRDRGLARPGDPITGDTLQRGFDAYAAERFGGEKK